MPARHVVKQGESVSSIAYRAGLSTETIWNHPDNSELRARRGNKNILAPGDLLTIPDKESTAVDCTTEERHRFRRRSVPAVFRIQLYRLGQPRAHAPFRFDDGKITTGYADADGIVEVRVSPGATSGVVIVGPPDEDVFDVRFGALDPADDETGAHKRLANLGLCDEEDGGDEVLAEALRAFQKSVGITQTGEFDPETRDRLAAIHDEQGPMPELGEGL